MDSSDYYLGIDVSKGYADFVMIDTAKNINSCPSSIPMAGAALSMPIRLSRLTLIRTMMSMKPFLNHTSPKTYSPS